MVGEALGLAVGHTALAPSGEPVWLEGGLRAVAAVAAATERGQTTADVLSDDAVHNAMVVHAAFGGSTNLLLHLPAIAHAAGLRRPTAADWLAVARSTRGSSRCCPTDLVRIEIDTVRLKDPAQLH